MKSKSTAYLLWLISGFGWLGFHHFYCGKILKGIIWILTGGFFGIGALIDLFTLGGQVDSYNTKQELKTIRTASLANLASRANNATVKKEQIKISEKAEPTSEKMFEANHQTKTKEKRHSENSILLQILKIISAYKKSILKYGILLILLLILIKTITSLIVPNFSDPKNVIEKTEVLWRKGDLKSYYKYLSTNSKLTYESFDDFLKIKHIPDSALKTIESFSITATEIEMENFDKFKRFEIKAIAKINGQFDTSNYIRTVFNENEHWKLVWNKELLKKASVFSKKGDFKQSTEFYNEAIELDPFSLEARTQIVWSYLRNSERPVYWEDTIIHHLNYGIALDSLDGDLYNAIGAYYTDVNNYKKAVNSFLLSAKYYKDSAGIANAFSNAAQNAKNYNVLLAETYLDKSLKYNKNSVFAWQTYGDFLYRSEKYKSAREKYFQAIELIENANNLDTYTLINLYGQYALTCKKIGLKNEAEEYILKCIRVYPDKKHPIFKKLNL